jgi:hypothetical protein
MSEDLRERIVSWCSAGGLFAGDDAGDGRVFCLKVLAPGVPGEAASDETMLAVEQRSSLADRILVSGAIVFDRRVRDVMRTFDQDALVQGLERQLDALPPAHLIDYQDGTIASVTAVDEIFVDGLTRDRLMQSLRDVHRAIRVTLWMLKPVLDEVPDHPAGRFCPSCGAEAGESSSFCRRCGAGLARFPVQAVPAACAACGEPWQDDDRFCARCGAPRHGERRVPDRTAAAAPTAPPVAGTTAPMPAAPGRPAGTEARSLWWPESLRWSIAFILIVLFAGVLGYGVSEGEPGAAVVFGGGAAAALVVTRRLMLGRRRAGRPPARSVPVSGQTAAADGAHNIRTMKSGHLALRIIILLGLLALARAIGPEIARWMR